MQSDGSHLQSMTLLASEGSQQNKGASIDVNRNRAQNCGDRTVFDKSTLVEVMPKAFPGKAASKPLPSFRPLALSVIDTHASSYDYGYETLRLVDNAPLYFTLYALLYAQDTIQSFALSQRFRETPERQSP